MKRLFAILLLLVCVSAPAFAQTYFNPTIVAFNHPDYATTLYYRVQFFDAATTVLIDTPPLAQWDVVATLVVVADPGPPVLYNLLLKDVYVFLPFGKSYVLRLLACDNGACSPPSEITRELVRYTYCVGTPNTTVKPLTITQPAPPIGAVGKYVPISLTVASLRPVHAINIQLVGAGVPAYYFTGVDMRNTITLSLGPLPRAGRYLMNITAADENGCSASQASQYLTVR